ncbi:MAG: bifunctional pyrazinamidase/nicotinamidase [Rhodocyclaceae bacterium]|uniref:nicotinamidase n=1 Tax=Candidatus Desulfobacillus denitrificans TaxID=2608985 RepID=A0A809SAM1_9PROT|nr:isochorismatase family protein [Rhodocyclaceae bacterium]OQY72501.1 MAG: nicotinamidase [Rhodocyclaceae bacterium UTPRO2]BBO20994.1 nicotinamidase [Candidatus Desulfobacillus denitrificans]GIK45260.1 MAG: bifunctional pyrazinamidase/nicotinamidase [Betaproteobacteria bacterium]GJQ53660.1 MAG: bifunctional pyrazinamidase/nicotinamidase [Rhodocyclaceae bacterium]
MIGDGVHLQAGDALIMVDVQLDFLPGGSLAVPHGDEVVPALNRYIAVFRGLTFPIVATRDWHPPDHCSFRAQGGPWPPHCVAGSAGAHFATLLDLPCEAHIVSKATSRDRDAYSGFEGTGLDDWLRRAGASRVFVGGLATDYCVLNTVRDALRFGYATFLLLDAVRAVDVAAGDGARAIDEMRRLGAMAIEYGQVAA